MPCWNYAQHTVNPWLFGHNHIIDPSPSLIHAHEEMTVMSSTEIKEWLNHSSTGTLKESWNTKCVPLLKRRLHRVMCKPLVFRVYGYYVRELMETKLRC